MMMKSDKTKAGPWWMSARRIGRVGVVIGAALTVAGCSLAQAPVIDTAGPIAGDERDMMLKAFALMMIVAIPVFVMTAWFAIRYRASNEKAAYRPEWCQSSWIELAVWAVPALIVVALGVLVWSGTHRLDPYRPLSGHGAPLKVQAVAQDWKWLFIYPALGVATVNDLVIPRDRPVEFEITSDTVMTAFFIPRLAGQIYAMAGMRSKLNLRADVTGSFVGRNAQYNGRGFSDQSFAVRVTSAADFGDWLRMMKAAPERLDKGGYEMMAAARATSPVRHFGTVAPGLFDWIIKKYRKTRGKMAATSPAAAWRR